MWVSVPTPMPIDTARLKLFPMASAPSEVSHCRIEQSLGRSEICPGASCPFWERYSGASAGGCLFDKLDLAGRRELAGWLHERREQLQAPGPIGDRARQIFSARLNARRSS